MLKMDSEVVLNYHTGYYNIEKMQKGKKKLIKPKVLCYF